jgi:hypothetical protein
MVDDLKTLVFKYETSNMISQSCVLSVLLISMPVFLTERDKILFSKKRFKVYKILNAVSLERKLSGVNVELFTFTLELFSSISDQNSFYNPLKYFFILVIKD